MYDVGNQVKQDCSRAICGAACSLFAKTYQFPPCLQAHHPEQRVSPCVDFHKTRAFQYRILLQLRPECRRNVRKSLRTLRTLTSSLQQLSALTFYQRHCVVILISNSTTQSQITQNYWQQFFFARKAAWMPPSPLPPKSRILDNGQWFVWNFGAELHGNPTNALVTVPCHNGQTDRRTDEQTSSMYGVFWYKTIKRASTGSTKTLFLQLSALPCHIYDTQCAALPYL
jgi:hypothetical protein